MKRVLAAIATLALLSSSAFGIESVLPLPDGSVGVTGSSGNVANAAAVATLAAGGATKVTWITGFQCTSGGATASIGVIVTVAGVITGTMSYAFVVPVIGATNQGANGLNVSFDTPMPASAQNTAIVVTLPALGAGNLHASCSAQGFQM